MEGGRGGESREHPIPISGTSAGSEWMEGAMGARQLIEKRLASDLPFAGASGWSQECSGGGGGEPVTSSRETLRRTTQRRPRRTKPETESDREKVGRVKLESFGAPNCLWKANCQKTEEV